MDVYHEGKVVGKVKAISSVSQTNKIMEITYNGKNILIPYHKDFILNLDLQNKKIEVKLIEGMV